MNEDKVTNLDRLRAATEHARCYPDLTECLTGVNLDNYDRRVSLSLWAQTTAERLDALAQWAVSIEAAEVLVVGHEGAFHLYAYGTLASGQPAKVIVVITDPEPLVVDGIQPGRMVPLEQIATLQAVA